MSAFGSTVLPYQLEDRLKLVLSTWMDTYLREAERVASLDADDLSLASVKSWEAMSGAEERFPNQGLPGVQIMWEEIDLNIQAESAYAQVALVLEVMVESTSFGAARKRAGIYAYELMRIVLDKLDQDPMFDGVSTPHLALPVARNLATRRWLSIAAVEFTVTVPNFLTPGHGPAAPAADPAEPPPDYPTALTVDITVA